MDAFNGCKLESITVPSSVVCYNGGFIFEGCNIKDIHITDLSLWNESLNFSFPSDGWNLHINGRLATQISIPNGTAQIRASAFSGCVSLTNVVLPNSVTTIENNAFAHCTKLEKSIFPIMWLQLDIEPLWTRNWQALIYLMAQEPLMILLFMVAQSWKRSI